MLNGADYAKADAQEHKKEKREGAHQLVRRRSHRAPGARKQRALHPAREALSCVLKHAVGLGHVLEPK